MPKNKGTVYLVGAGPGDPELLTLKAARVLRAAQAVVYDRLANPRILAGVPADAQRIYVGKAADKHTMPQEEINALLVKLAREGRTVVRLKGGDPFVFGRGGEEILTLVREGIPFEVIPGVTSAIAVAAYAGIPVTHRGFTSSLGIFTGQEDPGKQDTGIAWEKIATGLGTLVFLMGVENLANIVKTLMKYGRSASTPAALVQWGTLPNQKSVNATLATIVEKAHKQAIAPPAILIVGEVVTLRQKMNWFESRPLFGRKVLVTVPAEDTSRLSALLEDQGAWCVEMPMIRIVPLKDYAALDKAIKTIDSYQWLVLTSQNGVKFFKQRLDALKLDARCLKGVRIATIGPRTKEAVEQLGVRIDLQPKTYTQEGLLGALKKERVRAQAILLVRAQEARDVLPQGLTKLGAKVKVIPAYKTELCVAGPREENALETLDLVTFTSSSCVEGFFKTFPRKEILSGRNRFLVASIGPVTSQTCKKFGLKVDIEARQFTLEGLAQAILDHFTKRSA
ncbi:MAG TPA: uroporphyrinogen-III C-methyltransferase [Candidatus Omnitrophota bacterium]|nr:uroporphyrinogen-III C-methyltransferase [Candidatus Omnitrophota bacterium]